jgi:DNA invertase Pin-like site-specific DNA recombinase
MPYDVIYTRFSTDLQRTESCADQERDVRRDLPCFGVNPENVLALKDEAESGTQANRNGGFERLCALIHRGEVRTLAVDDQARLSRADNTFQFIQDLVFAGGRFISTGEGIDTRQKGWELRVKVLELHNSHTIRELAHRVRRGQEGRVRDDGSAGDFPFGYESYYRDADWAEQLKRRGPKPKKGLRICEDEARWVRQVFAWFTAGQSISWIARELTRQGVPKGHRPGKPGWHHQQVRRMLANQKYLGRWVWGMTTTLRNSQGRLKKVPVPAGEEVVRERPDLRVIDPTTWEKAQKRLAALREQFGVQQGQKKRGPKAHPSTVYAQSLLGGLLVCGQCGAKLWSQRSGPQRHYACPAHRKGLCGLAGQVPAVRSEQALTAFLTELLSGWPDWLRDVYRRAREVVQEAAARVPEQQQQDSKQLADVRRRIGNLVAALAEGTLTSAAVQDKLTELEAEARRLQEQLAAYESLRPGEEVLPDDAWLAEQLRQWASGLTVDTARAAAILRQAVGPVTAHAVIAPGKRRGYMQLRFRLRGWEILCTVLGDHLPQGLPVTAKPAEGQRNASPEFVLDLGGPTEMDRWAPQIAAWRAEGVTWEEIVRRTGLDLNRVFVAWKRYTTAQSGGPDAA